jgi:hypothetical protein
VIRAAVLMGVAGCATAPVQQSQPAQQMHWYKDGASQTDLDRDRYDCAKENTTTIAGTTTSGVRPVTQTNWEMANMCLKARGWVFR